MAIADQPQCCLKNNIEYEYEHKSRGITGNGFEGLHAIALEKAESLDWNSA